MFLVLIVSQQSQVGNANCMHIKGICYGIIAENEKDAVNLYC